MVFKISQISSKTRRNFRLRACHISDTHGGLPKLSGRYDIVVHSGDILPNSYAVMNRNITQEMAFQLDWLTQNLINFKKWLQGTPFLFIPGNHDFLHPDIIEKTLNSEGIKAINLSNKRVMYEDISFYGFPYVPAIGGNMWNYEREIPEMDVEVGKMLDVINKDYTDVIVAHAPLYQILDLTKGNDTTGSTVIANAFDYEMNKNMLPLYYMHGHIHEANGLTVRNNMLISNAATTFHTIEIK
jgi:Icc-related predicted phosphoesterase